eukprot:Opistho-2@95390
MDGTASSALGDPGFDLSGHDVLDIIGKRLRSPERRNTKGCSVAADGDAIIATDHDRKRRKGIDTTNVHDMLRQINPTEVCGGLDGYFKCFEAVANTIMNHSILLIGASPHRICEIEFYVNTEEHADVQCHCEDLQLSAGHWYFHRKGAPFRTGTSQGVDITCGGPGMDGDAKQWYGGINVRSIQQLSDGKLICGPSLCVDHMIKTAGVSKTGDLVGTRGLIDDTDAVVHIVPDRGGVLSPARIHSSPRIGLTLKALRDPERYIMRPYRFLIMPDRLKKGKQHLMLQMHVAGASAGDVKTTCGVAQPVYARTIALFEEGKTMPFDSFIAKNLSPDDFCRMYGAHIASL